MIDLTVPAGQQPHDLVDKVLDDVLARRSSTASRPPKLLPAIERARGCQEDDDVAGLDEALLDVAVGAIATLVRLRAAL